MYINCGTGARSPPGNEFLVLSFELNKNRKLKGKVP